MAWTLQGLKGDLVDVTRRNMARVLGVQSGLTSFAAYRDARSWTIEFTQTPTAADYFFYLRNSSSTRDLIINRIEIDGTVAEIIQFQFVSGTPGGTLTDVAPVNRSVGSNNSFQGVSQSSASITGLTKLVTHEKFFVPAGGDSAVREMEDRIIVLPKGQSAALGVALFAPTGGNALNVLVQLATQTAEVEDLI